MPTRPLALLAVLSLVACEAPEVVFPDAGADALDAAGDEVDPICTAPSPKQLPAQPVTNGQLAPTLLTLTDGQQLAVGALVTPGRRGRWVNFCTATLVATDTVLTAAHCVFDRGETIDPDDFRFAIGTDMRGPVETFEVGAVHMHPRYRSSRGDASYDIAIVRLKVDATSVVPALAPIAVNRAPLGEALVGRDVQVVGFGLTDPNDSFNSVRYWTTEVIADVSTIDVVTDGNGESAVCFGDSGGPLLLADEAGVVRVYGTLSWGDPSCVDEDHFARVDRHLAWIEGDDVAGSLEDPPCGDVGAAGACADGLARWCDRGRLRVDDCAAEGLLCLADERGDHRCRPDPCGGLTFEGACDGDRAVWCEGGVRKEFDCGRCDLACGDTGGALGSFCVPRAG